MGVVKTIKNKNLARKLYLVPHPTEAFSHFCESHLHPAVHPSAADTCPTGNINAVKCGNEHFTVNSSSRNDSSISRSSKNNVAVEFLHRC